LKKFFGNSKVTMILSLCLAFLLWFYVSVFLNPEIDVNIRNVPVVYSDMQTLANRNLTVLNDQAMEIDVKLRGDRRTLKQITNKNITAIIDLKEYAKMGEHEIPISVKLPVDGVTLVSRSQRTMKVTVDYIATATVDVTVAVKGTPKAGYVYTNELVSEEKATIKGPQSIIKTISGAKATLDVSGATTSISTLADLVLVSANDVEVSSNMIEIAPSKVEAMCTVGYAKTVKVTVPVQNDPDKRIIASPSEYKEVTLVGKKSQLEKINQIETAPIDANNYYYDYDIVLDLKLPEGIITQSGMKSVKVHVDVVDS